MGWGGVVLSCAEGAYIVHGVHEFGEVVEPLGAGHHALVPHVDRLGQLPDVVLSHVFEHRLALESLERNWGGDRLKTNDLHSRNKCRKMKFQSTVIVF